MARNENGPAECSLESRHFDDIAPRILSKSRYVNTFRSAPNSPSWALGMHRSCGTTNQNQTPHRLVRVATFLNPTHTLVPQANQPGSKGRNRSIRGRTCSTLPSAAQPTAHRFLGGGGWTPGVIVRTSSSPKSNSTGFRKPESSRRSIISHMGHPWNSNRFTSSNLEPSKANRSGFWTSVCLQNHNPKRQ